MTYQEITDEIDKAFAKKKSFEQNRSICVVVLAILIYNTSSAARNDDPAWWFFVIMGLLIAGVFGVLAYGSVQVKKASDRLKELDILKAAEEVKLGLRTVESQVSNMESDAGEELDTSVEDDDDREPDTSVDDE